MRDILLQLLLQSSALFLRLRPAPRAMYKIVNQFLDSRLSHGLQQNFQQSGCNLNAARDAVRISGYYGAPERAFRRSDFR
ncbi:hypothetical protein F4814DRAFT_417786 [Daldinia grandis]|nr:hypothetical protein F4814DRAFT_417786 [Daldinia grandis]